MPPLVDEGAGVAAAVRRGPRLSPPTSGGKSQTSRSEFDRQEDDIHLVTLCVTELSDREENEKHFPIIYGIAVNVNTAEIYRVSLPDRGLEEELHAVGALPGGPMISI
ncbi:Protein N-terminal asparagine amidohydrolase [Camelus dromedarius]|uniref:Protein N-terminal asparagine amidohydrolase n=1 Tax=Camelus dromedarius TaxID=9838 RepID=A0A5N4EHM8_CAMDR|nr:Protein N-terminal asparagine amidohydrolase [Camelus dromedarius]